MNRRWIKWKKTLLASAITLSVFGLTTNLSYAEENQAPSAPVETTHSETSTDKVEKNSLPAKETEPSTEANANQTTNPAKKEEDKAPEVQKDGWVLEENIWRFYENNAPVLNWKKIHGKWYYFNKDGIMLSDTIFDGYILTSSGAMVDSGWSKLQDKWYYANAYGKISQQKWEKSVVSGTILIKTESCSATQFLTTICLPIVGPWLRVLG